jgi:hypothetical protein
LTVIDDEGVGAGRLQLLAASSSTASTVFDGRFKSRALAFGEARALSRRDYKGVT